MRDFSASSLRRLARKGIRILSTAAIPDMASSMPFANAVRGYTVDDNGCGRIWTFAQVQEAVRG